MSYDWENRLINAIVGLSVLVLLGTIGIVVVYVPAIVHAEATCLGMGYPKAVVTYKLDAYCMNLDGAATVHVEPIKEKSK